MSTGSYLRRIARGRVDQTLQLAVAVRVFGQEVQAGGTVVSQGVVPETEVTKGGEAYALARATLEVSLRRRSVRAFEW